MPLPRAVDALTAGGSRFLHSSYTAGKSDLRDNGRDNAVTESGRDG